MLGLNGAAAAPASMVALGVLALTVLGGVLRFTRLGHQGFWFDEGNTAFLVQFSPGKMLALIPKTEGTPPLYYCVAWVWSRIFGHHEAGLRSLSALAGVAVIPVAYGVGAKLVSRRAGVIVAALTACNPFLIWYSQEARSYSLLVLLTACALLAFAYALEQPSPRALTTWVIACGLAMATHYYGAVAVAPQAAWLLIAHRQRRGVLVAIGLVALCAVALVPLALAQHNTGHDSWISQAPLGRRLAQIIPQFLIGTNAPHRQVMKFLAMALALAALVLLFAFGRADERRGPLLAGSLVLSGFALSLAFIGVGADTLITRNILGLWLPAAVMVAGGLAVARTRAVGIALTVGLCAIGIIAAIGIAVDRSMQRPDWRYVARALGPQPAGAAPRAILIQHFRTLLPLSLYLPGLEAASARHPPVVRELNVIAMRSPQQPICWWGAACNLIPSTLQRTYHIPGFHVAWRGQVLQWQIMRLVSSRPVRLTPTAVSRSLHTTTLRRDELLVQR